MIVGAVGVTALAIGALAGRSASEPQHATTAVTVTTIGRTNLIEPIPTVEPPPSEDSATASTVTPTTVTPTTIASDQTVPIGGPFAGSAVGVAVALVGQPIEIIAIGNGRRLLQLDLTTGQYRDQPAPIQPFGRPRVLVSDAGLLFPSSDPTLPSALLARDGSLRDVDLGPVAGVFGGASGGVWRQGSGTSDDSSISFEPISAEGEPLGPPVELPVAPIGLDPAGGFIVETIGGVYRVDASGRRRVTSGTLVALNVDDVVARECDELLVCGVVVIDRSTGERRVLSTDLPKLQAVSGSTISADGGAAIVRVVDPVDRSASQPTLGIVDLGSGELTEIGPAQNIDESIWTPDGRFVLYNSGGRIVAHDRLEGEQFVVADEFIAIDTFTVRSSPDAR